MTTNCPDLGNMTFHLGERGFYTLLATGSPSNFSLQIIRDIKGDADHGPDTMPVLYTFLVLAVAFSGYYSLRWLWYARLSRSAQKRYKLLVNESGASTGAGAPEGSPLLASAGERDRATAEEGQPGRVSHAAIANPKTSRVRLQSLDSFRGFALTIMIFVNYNGGYYYFFSHSLWNGLTVADLVFPWFVWIMGTSMAIAFNSLLRRKTPRKTMLYKVVRRACVLFALGLALSNLYDLRNGRIPNVLQRFAISYLVVGLIMLYVPKMPQWWVGGSSATDVASTPPALAHVS